VILEALEGFLASVPLFAPAAALRGNGYAALIVGLVTGIVTVALATRRRVLSITNVESGGSSVGALIFARLMSCMGILLPMILAQGAAGGIESAGRLTIGNLALMSLGAMVPDIVAAQMMSSRGRRGLALLLLMNVPVTGVVWPHIALSTYLLTSRARWTPGRGIEIGTVRASITHGIRTLRGRDEDIRSMETDWFVDDRFGPFRLVWSPRQENGEHNPHVVVAGKSGAGKSTFLYHLILWLLANGCGVTVIDMTGQYVKYARWLRTSDSRELHRTLNLDGDRAREELPAGMPQVRTIPIVIRGFEIIGEEDSIPEIVSSQLTYSLSLVDRMALGSNQQYFLSEAVSRASLRASREGRTMRLSDVVSELDDLMGVELMDSMGRIVERDTYEAISSLRRRLSLLSLYVEPDGEPARAMEIVARGCGRSHPEKQGRRERCEWGELVVVDLSPIPDEEVRVIAAELVLKKIFWTVKRRFYGHMAQRHPWFLVVDEAWKLLSPGIETTHRTVLVDFFREARNYGIGIVALTQHLTDLGKEAYNASLQVFLAVTEPSEVEKLAKRITARGAEQLEEVLMRLKPHQSVVRVDVPIERIARVSRYRGAAVEWVVAELRRLYIPEERMRRINEEYVRYYQRNCEKAVASRRERNRIPPPPAAALAQQASQQTTIQRQEAPKAAPRELARIRVSLRSPAQQAPAQAPRVGSDRDPLEELSKALGVERELAVAVALAAANKWLVVHRGRGRSFSLEVSRLPEPFAKALGARSLIDPSTRIFRANFLKAVSKVEEDQQLLNLASAVARMSCPSCLAYPADSSHACGGVDR
jgi:hypothetical protein